MRTRLERPRRDLLSEQVAGDGTFHQLTGPFKEYERRVTEQDGRLVERTRVPARDTVVRVAVRAPVRALLGRRGQSPVHSDRAPGHTPWWAPPDQIDARQALVLGLLAAASMSSAFTNTLFTQTAEFAADDFNVGNFGFSVAGAVVRTGIIISLPLAFLADRVGRRRIIRIVVWGGTDRHRGRRAGTRPFPSWWRRRRSAGRSASPSIS